VGKMNVHEAREKILGDMRTKHRTPGKRILRENKLLEVGIPKKEEPTIK